jgi:citronellol/citronellal dehydrogenase
MPNDPAASADLTSRVALVTGGGTGIGAASARALAAGGASVVLAGRTVERLERVAAAVHDETGQTCLTVRADVREESDCVALVERTVAELGGVDILVNNAGGARLVPLESTSTRLWDNTFALNVRGPFLLTRQVGPSMIERGGGSIINISSAAGLHGVLGGSAYGASKAGLQMLTLITAGEWGRFGIRANAIAVGLVASENALTAWDAAAIPTEVLSATTPLRRVGQPSEIADLVRYLAGDAASFVTGQVISADGGPQMTGIPLD